MMTREELQVIYKCVRRIEDLADDFYRLRVEKSSIVKLDATYIMKMIEKEIGQQE